MGIFERRVGSSIRMVDMEIEQYKPKCPRCKKEISEIHRFLLNGNEEAVYSCPLCHEIISIGSR
jgi:hypothetical protein